MSSKTYLLGGKLLLMTGISILAVAANDKAAMAEDFIDTPSMQRHAAGGPPSIPSPMHLLLADPAQQFIRDGELPQSTGVEADVVKANKMVKVMAGYDGNSNALYSGGQVKVMAPGIVMLAGARYDKADNYDDANGNEVSFGYERDTEQVMLQFMPGSGSKLRLIGVRDVIKDDKQPHHAMDVTNTERLVGKALFTQELDGDVLTGFGLDFASRNVKREPDNYSNRPNGGTRMRAETERHILEGGGHLNLNLAGWKSKLALSGIWDNHDARRYNVTAGDRVNAIKLPDITRTGFSAAFDGERMFGDGYKLHAGLRYDYIHADPEAVNQTGQMVTPPGATPQQIAQANAFNMSPSQLYQSYYGLTGDHDRDDHNISARVNLSRAFMDKRFKLFADLSRKVRSPDNIEAYHAVTHPMAANRWIGNPGLDPEAHHKAELGFVWSGTNYKGYGKLGQDADSPLDLNNMQIKLSGYVDAVDNFIAWDRARNQSGINQNDNALIYRNVDAVFAGINFEARWNLTNNWSTAAKLSYLYGNNESDSRALYQIAPLEANFLIDYQDMLGSVGTWNVGAKLRLVSDQTRVDDSMATGLGMDQGTGKGFATVDLYGGMQISNRLSLKAGVNNVFDTDYQEHITGTHIASPTKSKINAPGRNFFIRSQLNF